MQLITNANNPIQHETDQTFWVLFYKHKSNVITLCNQWVQRGYYNEYYNKYYQNTCIKVTQSSFIINVPIEILGTGSFIGYERHEVPSSETLYNKIKQEFNYEYNKNVR